jgi:hypothetical protein
MAGREQGPCVSMSRKNKKKQTDITGLRLSGAALPLKKALDVQLKLVIPDQDA